MKGAIMVIWIADSSGFPQHKYPAGTRLLFLPEDLDIARSRILLIGKITPGGIGVQDQIPVIMGIFYKKTKVMPLMKDPQRKLQ
jgi:hypothetical protein